MVCEFNGRADCPDRVAKLIPELPTSPVEQVIVVGLSGQYNPIAKWVVSSGTLQQSLVHPREVFGPALRIGTVAAIVIAHNHPSGSKDASAEDVALTNRIIKAGALLGIPVLDHVILTPCGHTTSIRCSHSQLWV